MLTGLTGLMLLIKLCKPLDIFKIRNNKEGKTYTSQGSSAGHERYQWAERR